MWTQKAAETISHDLRHGCRVLIKNPRFTALAVLTVALGIGSTTAIFTVANGVLLRPLPYPHPEELVFIKEDLGPPVGILPFAFSRDLASWERRTQTLSKVGAYMYSWANLTGAAESERVTCGVATSSLFSLLGVHPEVGRLFLPEEGRPGGPPVVILSHALWQRRFGGDPSVVGKALTLDGTTYTIVGVLPHKFLIPDQVRLKYDLWKALMLSETVPGQFPAVRAIGRLKSGVSLRQVSSELDAILQSAVVKGPKRQAIVVRWHDEIVGSAKLPLYLLSAAVGLLLLIVCVNVANLQLARAPSREKETAVRLALGACRARVIRQLITESILLSLFGGAIGLVLAFWWRDLLLAFVSVNLPNLEPIGLDYRVLGFNLGLALLVGLAFGVAPALQASGIRVNDCLKEGGRGTPQRGLGLRLRSLLVVLEVALAMVLLVGGGLLFRSFLRVGSIDPGFNAENILSVTIDLTPSRYPTPQSQASFFERAMDGIKGLEGVQWVGATSSPPMGEHFAAVPELLVEGRQEKIPGFTPYATVSPDYFRTMEIPLVQGRHFTGTDREGTLSVAIVNESFARRYFSGQDCLGTRIANWIRKGDWVVIVGVVGDIRNALEKEPSPQIFLPVLQTGGVRMTLLVRTDGSPTLRAAGVRDIVARVDRDQPPHHVMSMEEILAKSLASRRVNTLLLGGFAILGLVLASSGIYGVVSYSVGRRTHEIGVRMALGAARGDVVRLVLRQSLSLALIGTGIGVAGSLAVTRLLRTMLFAVKPFDLPSFLAAALILACVALLASYLPARRATKIDPVLALHCE